MNWGFGISKSAAPSTHSSSSIESDRSKSIKPTDSLDISMGRVADELMKKETNQSTDTAQQGANANSSDLSNGMQKMNINQRHVPSNTRRTTYNQDETQDDSQDNIDSGSYFPDRLGPIDTPIEGTQIKAKFDTINYDAIKMIGHGSFGAVFLAKVTETNETVAIKKVLQDRRFKNRELQIMKQLSKQSHPYVLQMQHHFISKGSKPDDIYLNLVLEYVPETVYSVLKHHNKLKEPFPILDVKLYMYQLGRALAHIHGMGICHRDIKPQNLLVDPERHVLKLCDFGSAKQLIQGEPNVAYICSRYYRAPELIFGATDYTVIIDIWSTGCVFAELLLGTPVFPGSSGVDQLVEIIKVLGTPSKQQLHAMNPNYQEFKFPNIQATSWNSIFKATVPSDAIDCISQMLKYVPNDRLKALEICNHTFFDEIRNSTTKLPDGKPLPMDLFIFTKEELFQTPELADVLVPSHLKETLLAIRSAKKLNDISSDAMPLSQLETIREEENALTDAEVPIVPKILQPSQDAQDSGSSEVIS